jgi:hypothetical protein
MQVDLKCRGLISRSSVVIDPDEVIILEHSLFSDRVRRLGLDRIEQVAWMRVVPWVTLLVVGLLIVLPAALLLIISANLNTTGSQYYGLSVGATLLVFGIAAMLWHSICRTSRIFITRAGQTRELRTVTRPGKVDRFLARLFQAIHQAQQPTDGASEPTEPQGREDEAS